MDRFEFWFSHGRTLMIVNNLDFVGVAAFPPKANTPLCIDSDTVLVLSVAVESLETITGRDSQVIERLRSVKKEEFSQPNASHRKREPLNRFSPK